MSGRNNKEKRTKGNKQNTKKYKRNNTELINDDKLPNLTEEGLNYIYLTKIKSYQT